MHLEKKSSSASKKYPPGSFMDKLRKRKIIHTLAAFIGGGWLTYEVVHWVLVDHYHLPERLKDVTIVTFFGALLSTLIWQWFRSVEKKPGNVKVEVLLVPLVILATLTIDLNLILPIIGIPINMFFIGIIALCLGIAWIVFKSLQWAVSIPEAERMRDEILKPIDAKPISLPKWRNSIVVLPFENISPEEGQDYFCDGMTEEIITDLSSIHDLRVISRSSAMMLKGSKKAVRDVARELNVQYVLEGSVRKAENDIRITAQLIDATSDAHLWAEKYSGTLDDVFDMQEKVSRSIVNALKLKLRPEEKEKIKERPIENLKAYDCYLRAKREMDRLTKSGLEHALRDLHNALEIVGENAHLYEGIGEAYLNCYEFGIEASEATLKKAEEYANRVLKLKPDSPGSHYLLGRIERFRGSVLKAIEHFKKALALDPKHQATLEWQSLGYAWQAGRPSEAEKFARKLIEIDPLNSFNHGILGFALWMSGKLDQAISSFEKCEKLEPESIIPKFWIVIILAWKKDYKRAFEMVEQLVQQKSQDVMRATFTKYLIAFKYAWKGKSEEALSSMTDDLKEIAWNDPDFPWLWAGFYALVNEKDEALRWLEHSVNRGFINYPVLSKKDPFLENIRGEKRFKKLMERVKYEWENFDV